MTNGTTDTTFTPRYPNLIAFACLTLFVLILCAPMFAGKTLLGPGSDQFSAGYPFTVFWNDYVRAQGAVPQWDPYIFGGLPYIAAPHGSTFHPIVLLRFILPPDLAINASFLIHLILAGFFAYLFFREYKLPWVAAVAGALAFQLTGQVASLVNSGHEGKVIVSGLLPLALWGLTRWIRAGRVSGAAILSISVGLAILSPQLQMAYYLMLCAGLFALYLAFLDPECPAQRVAVLRLAGSLGAVMLGGAIAAIQVLPFLQYIAFSPRADQGVSSGWLHATSWAMPPEELIDTFLPQFSGLKDLYSGTNVFKGHTEYLGVVALILASIGVTQTAPARSRLRWAFVTLALFFLTFALAGATPFFRIWYAILPMISKARAHSMAFYIVAFAVAVWVAFGVERILERRPTKGLVAWMVGLGVVLLFGLSGAWSNLARSFADPAKIENIAANRDALLWGTLRVVAFGAAVLGLIWAWGQGRVRAVPFAALLFGLIGLDLYTIDRQFFVYAPRARELFAPDAITEQIRKTPLPYRVFDTGVYGASVLMSYGIPQVLGYHGTEVAAYDELLGGKNAWRNLRYPPLFRLLAIRYVIFGDSVNLPGYHRVLGPIPNTFGARSYLYEADNPPPYVRVVPAAIKGEADRIIPTLIDPRLDYDRVVLFTPDEPVNPLPVDSMPPPSPSKAQVTAWEPGRMSIALDPVPPKPSYVLVSENWYLDWHATVDGADAQVLKGDQTFITVPVPAGARRVELVYRSSRYGTGKLMSILATLIVLGCLAGPPLTKRFARRA